MREQRTEVLVVGAGPVGLWTALLLAEAGIEVKVIDHEARTAARSYACALHPRTLKLFQKRGLLEPLLSLGHRVQRIAFYDRAERRAELDLPAAAGDFLLILPQDALERTLEERLREAGVNVYWHHRFDDLAQEDETVSVTVEELGGTGTGYIVPHWESVVKNRQTVQVQFLIGADGHQSLVRQRLGLNYQSFGDPQFFAAFEFESDTPAPDEVRVVLDQTTNVLWPLPGNKCRWTFQLLRGEHSGDFPEKERRAVRMAEPLVDEQIRQSVQRVAQQRAPWFKTQLKQITWCTEVVFTPGLASIFGQGRCWLAGDAAHQTGPVGVQSMNAGFHEGNRLAERLVKILKADEPLSSLKTYNQEQTGRWRQLLGATGGLKAGKETDPWLESHRDKLLSCLPGSGPDLAPLAQSLGLTLAQNELSTMEKV